MFKHRSFSEMMASEILTKVNNAKDKTKKIAVLKQYDNTRRQYQAFDPKIEWIYQKNSALYE